jgi:hypothetical protein
MEASHVPQFNSLTFLVSSTTCNPNGYCKNWQSALHVAALVRKENDKTLINREDTRTVLGLSFPKQKTLMWII